jgi:uncharacterized protein (TIGR02147 family)
LPNIYSYIDFREFLKSYYIEQKSVTPSFSHRQFLNKAGISSPSFLKQIIDAKRNLTEKTTEQFLKALKLKKRESLFFKTLVLFNQAKTSANKQKFYLQLREISKAAETKIVGSEAFDYYQNWYTSALRELISMHPHASPGVLGKLLHPQVSGREIKKSLQLLLNLGLLERTPTGWKQKDQNISTGHEVSSMVVRDFNRKMLDLAEASLDRFPQAERNITGVTLGASKKTYAVLVEEIKAFQDRVMNILSQDKNPEKVYQMNVVLFPLSQEKQE